jgi:hypothetical protein
MADPYSGVSITGYNSNPPADDGSAVEANRVKWATIKTKITDPVKTRTDDMNTALIAAFGKIDGGITSTSIGYTVLSTDQGKLVRATASGITITTPDATDVDAPFVFELLNDSTGDITFDGSGSQTIDGDASVTVPAGAGFRVRTDGTNWFTGGQNFQRGLTQPQGYLTVISTASSPTSPIVNSDQAAAGALFYRPYKGNLVPISNGTLFTVREFAEKTLTLHANHVANGIYDVFLFDDNGTITIGTGPVWTTVTAGSGARGTGAGTTELDLLKGLLVNKVAVTMRNGATTYSVGALSGLYVGTILIDGSAGQVSCHVTWGSSRKWGVWNAYNHETISLQTGENTSSWNNASATVRPSNNTATNVVSLVIGLPVVRVNITHTQRMSLKPDGASSTEQAVTCGIGINSSSAFSGTQGFVTVDSNAVGGTTGAYGSTATALHTMQPAIGAHNIFAMEQGNSASNVVVLFYGTQANQALKVEYRA